MLRNKMSNLLNYAVTFLIVSLIAGFIGYGGIPGIAPESARILAWAALMNSFVIISVLLVRKS
jgi:uncharacterized membrane protein YtjA (UPF0391 family)